MQRLVCLLAGLALIASPVSSASAATDGELVVEVKGKSNVGISRFSRALRRQLANKLGGLRSARELRSEQDRLQQLGKDRTKPSKLAEATRNIGARHLLFVRLAKKGRTYTAKAYLIAAEDGKIAKKMSHTYKAAKRSGVTGRTIADETLEFLGTLEPVAAAPVTTLPDTPVESKAPALPAWGSDTKTTETPPTETPPTTASPTMAAPAASSTPPATASQVPILDTPITPSKPTKEPAVEVRLAAGVGAGLVRRYSLSSISLPTSDLSHSLSPTALIELQGEVNVHAVDVGLMVKANLRPVSYAVAADTRVEEPGGLLIDGRAMLNYRWEITQRAGKPLELLPRAGVQLARSSVGEHMDDILVSSTALALIFGVGVRVPYDAQLEFDLGADLGPVLSYSESPSSSGSNGGGLAFNADFAARYWFSKRISLALSSQFSLARIGFEGAPTRAVARDEVGRIFDASLTVTDFGSALIVGTRF